MNLSWTFVQLFAFATKAQTYGAHPQFAARLADSWDFKVALISRAPPARGNALRMTGEEE
jgi:hypothetical protein